RSKAEYARAQELLRALGGLLPPGLVAAARFLGRVAYPSAPRLSIAARFAAISKFRLVLRRFARNRRAGYEQLSADDRHQRSPRPDEALWMARSHAELQHLHQQQ